MTGGPPGQTSSLLFPLGTDINDAVVLQIPFTDFNATEDGSFIIGLYVGMNKGTGGQYELIIDDVEFY